MSLSRIATLLVALVVGLVFGVAGTIGQSVSWGWFPIGFIAALVGAVAIIAAVRLLTGDRWSSLATAIGVMIATLVFSGRGPGGSVVVPAPPEGEISTGLIWTIAVPLVAAIVIAWPSPAALRPAAHAEPRPDSGATN